MKYLALIILLFLTVSLKGQEYFRAVGVRGGLTAGITYRQFLDPELAYEGIASFRRGGLQFTVLRQHFEPVLWRISDEFFLTYGYGGHMGFSYTNTYKYFFKEYYYSEKKFSPLVGIDGYLGFEYHFPSIPVQIGIDLKPFFEFNLMEFFNMSIWDAAFTLKYNF